MKINAYVIAVSQAWEIINVINHITFICKYEVKCSAWSKMSWFLYIYAEIKENLNSIYIKDSA